MRCEKNNEVRATEMRKNFDFLIISHGKSKAQNKHSACLPRSQAERRDPRQQAAPPGGGKNDCYQCKRKRVGGVFIKGQRTIITSSPPKKGMTGGSSKEKSKMIVCECESQRRDPWHRGGRSRTDETLTKHEGR